MATIELKEELHRKIDALSDMAELLDLKYSIDWFIADQPTDEERQVLRRLGKVPELAENQTGIPHEEVMNEARTQWLKR